MKRSTKTYPEHVMKFDENSIFAYGSMQDLEKVVALVTSYQGHKEERRL